MLLERSFSRGFICRVECIEITLDWGLGVDDQSARTRNRNHTIRPIGTFVGSHVYLLVKVAIAYQAHKLENAAKVYLTPLAFNIWRTQCRCQLLSRTLDILTALTQVNGRLRKYSQLFW